MSESWPGGSKSCEVLVDRNVQIKMRDGVITKADVYRPRAVGRYPILLVRTPYDKGQLNNPTMLRPLRAVDRGYGVVVQDVRGRFASEGKFDPFHQEFNDGYDSVEWCASQSWSDGKVGMYGGSYVGATQWLAAASVPPHLKCIVPFITASNYYEEWFYRGGALQLSFVEYWCLADFCSTDLARNGRDEEAERMLGVMDRMNEAFNFLPVKEIPYFRGNADFFYDWVSHPEQDEYWENFNLENYHDKIEVPSFNLGGWYDIFLQGTISNFQRMRSLGKTKESREQKLLIGPWMHAGRAPWMDKLVGEVDFGHKASFENADVEGMMLDFYDMWIKGISPKKDLPAVRIFVMGENVWRDEKEWPLARTRFTDYYFHSGGSANSLNGDGVLDETLPGDERADRYVYDPLDPTPTIGGALCCDATYNPAGPYDQTPVEKRKDVLVYSTPPLEGSLEVTGPVAMKLFSSTSAEDTDFTAKLVDVWPCGFAQTLTQGIIRARYRKSRKKAEFVEPGQIYEYNIDIWSTSNLFRSNHRIRVEVSSSNFPHFNRNMNTTKPVLEEGTPLVAVQHVFHDRAHPSCIILPVIPR